MYSRWNIISGIMDLMNPTAHRLTEVMRKRGLDQPDVAKGVGATQGAISKIITGETKNSRLIPKLATFLGVSVPWLLGQSDDPSGEGEEALLDHESREMVRQFNHLAPADRRALLQIARTMAGGAPPSETVHARGGGGKAALHDKQQDFSGEKE